MHTTLTQRRDQIIIELRRVEGRWPEVSRISGVSHSWISQFARRKIQNPGVETLERVAGAIASMTEHSK